MLNFSKQIEIIANYDVVVIGGGVSGIGAAIEAARQGARVIILERSGILGGMLTAGHVSPPLGHYVKNTLADEILTAANCVYNSGRSHDMEEMKILITRLVEENGIAVYYECALADVVKNGRIITHAIVTTQSGLKAVGGKIFIDATGDGVLSYLCGEKVMYGRDDGLVQPMSIMFTIENVSPEQKLLCFHEEMDTQLDNGSYLQLCRDAAENGELPSNINIVRLYRGTVDTERMVNATQANGFNPLLPEDLGKAHALLRRQIRQVVNFLKTNIKGFENIRIKQSSDGVGVRESRRIACEYMLTSEDLLGGKTFPDVIVHQAAFCLDIHNPSGAGQSEQDGRPRQSKLYDIPYRSIIPLETDNLLIAGRCIGGTHRAHSSYRVMNICINIGQAAGAAAAICTSENTFPRALDYKKIQAVLTNKGINLFD